MKKILSIMIVFVLCRLITNAQTVPSINSISPLSGKAGTIVTINGNNFSTTVSNNVVYFGNTRATIISATSTVLTVKAPREATNGTITITTNGLITDSFKNFDYIFDDAEFTCNFQEFTLQVPTQQDYDASFYLIDDFNNDGKSDIIEIYSNNSDNFIYLAIYQNNYNHLIFSDSSYLQPEIIKIFANFEYSYIGAASGDIDGDGKKDIVVPGNDTLYIFRNISTSNKIAFEKIKIYYPNISPTYAIQIKDINLDGKPEIIAMCDGATAEGIFVFNNKCSPNNISQNTFDVFYFNCSNDWDSFDMWVEDIDGDGYPEIITVDHHSSNTYGHINIYKNQCTNNQINSSTFSTPYVLTTNYYPYSIALGDLTGDGKLDIAVSYASDNPISVFQNNSTIGNINFGTRVDMPIINGVYMTSSGVCIADLDGDGKKI